MNKETRYSSPARWLVGLAGLAAACYGAYASLAWIRYGRTRQSRTGEETDPLLDRFMPDYEVAEKHQIRVAAPAQVTYEEACAMDLGASSVIRAIFRAREIVLGAKATEETGPRGLVEKTKAMGWGVLAEIPGREIVMGAVTQPWAKDVVFRALPPDEFVGFREPGYVKIVWTIRADPDGEFHSTHRTETRARATDPAARAKFRKYWAAFSAGIRLIRRIGVRQVKTSAEQTARAHRARRIACPIG